MARQTNPMSLRPQFPIDFRAPNQSTMFFFRKNNSQHNLRNLPIFGLLK